MSSASLEVGFYEETCPRAEAMDCDGLVLLDSTRGNPTEKESPTRGYQVIDDAKTTLGAYCIRTVSCADILIFAACDFVYFSSAVNYFVPAGRHDDQVSIQSEVLQNNSFPTFNAEQLCRNFANKTSFLMLW
ncbi:hypothetical protein J5N97_021354 [Dioscorea zingiberensis]|uniref:Plant heme peroxidase family profile domain-containing protein n=1 Tax=Dioscorea zingiberensis TaxID=325984 RepID=A0A9D5HEJ2_9LILI|nr:hypothetical protein J5N97_021354 [Dioscorea zingiberensis]